MHLNEKKSQSWGYDRQLFRLLISPSWISGLFCVVASMAATTTLLIQEQYEGGELQKQFAAWQQAGEGISFFEAVSNVRYGSIGEILGTVQLFIFWYLVGLLLYIIFSAIYHVVQSAQEVRRDLGYVNANKRHIVVEVALRLLRQCVALLTWTLLTIATLKLVVPYAFSAVQMAHERMPSIPAFMALLATVAGLALCLHLHIILMRLFVGRPRVWNSEEYIESTHATNN
jgi:hypothetical protein